MSHFIEEHYREHAHQQGTGDKAGSMPYLQLRRRDHYLPLAMAAVV
jgi:hypothetical protein